MDHTDKKILHIIQKNSKILLDKKFKKFIKISRIKLIFYSNVHNQKITKSQFFSRKNRFFETLMNFLRVGILRDRRAESTY